MPLVASAYTHSLDSVVRAPTMSTRAICLLILATLSFFSGTLSQGRNLFGSCSYFYIIIPRSVDIFPQLSAFRYASLSTGNYRARDASRSWPHSPARCL